MLIAKNLSYTFEYPLFDNLSFELKPATSMAVLGVSGSGKSTLLHILASFLKPCVGEVIYKNSSLYEQNEREILSIRRHDFGIVFQSHYLFRGFTAMENLKVASLLSGVDVDAKLLKRLGVEHVVQQCTTTLSGGQMQRMSIARVLTKKPKIIFADEPTGNLDRHNADEVMNCIFEYVQENNAALFLVTHDENLASRCNSLFRLENRTLTPLK